MEAFPVIPVLQPNPMSDKDVDFQEQIAHCLMQQLQELELLQSMYPNPGELLLTNPAILELVEEFITHRTEYAPGHIDFTVTLVVEKLKLEVCIDLPFMYPLDEPDILVRCNQLNRKQQTDLNTDMAEYLSTVPKGESCLYSMIVWLQDNAENYWVDADSPKCMSQAQADISQRFARFWIYSHHIYNKKKRDEIITNAKDLDLTGFCLPGKPGIICIEGEEAKCSEWWQIIKSMTWKKIMIRKTEFGDDISNISEQRKFDKFEELHFPNPNNKKSKHMDMSRFSKCMEEHDLSEAFNDFFGLCNE